MNQGREIMVIKGEILFLRKQFNGFVKSNEFDFETLILKNYEWMNKKIAEKNVLFKQPIGYVIIFNPVLDKVFVYQRSKKHKDSDKRLYGKYSCGVGGHIEKGDALGHNPIYSSILREVDEEVEILGSKKLKIIGYINDNDNVGSVHFGILCILETDSSIITPKSPEINTGEFMNIAALENMCNSTEFDVESWTKIALHPLKKLSESADKHK